MMPRSSLSLILRLRADEEGLAAVEYAMPGAIVVAAIAAVSVPFQSGLSTAFDKILTGA